MFFSLNVVVVREKQASTMLLRVFQKACVCICLLFWSTGIVATQEIQKDDTKTGAIKAWEMAITAKGGRDRLYKIETILNSSIKESRTISVKESRTTLGKTYVAHHESLIVLPDKVWVYSDESASVFGITVSMLNYENLTGYFGQGPTKVTPLSPHERTLKGYQNATILYLMESKWLKPEIVGMRSEKADGVDVYLIETCIDGRRVDFALDKKTYLPVQIRFHNVSSNGKTYIHTARLTKYVDVDGIKVPQEMSYSDTVTRGGTEKLTIQFNVEYDPDIFIKPPAKLTPDAWKRKASKQ